MRGDIDLEMYLRILEEMREDLTVIRDGQEKGAGTVELDQARMGRLSRMDALQQQAMARAGRDRSAARLGMIDAALRRIKEGEYGCCLGCGEDIAENRLKVDPAASLCIHCARTSDHG